MTIAIKVENLSKCYHIYDNPHDRLKQFVLPRLQRLARQSPKQYFREFWALKEVSFEVKKGETVGIIGRNVSGKSTLLQLICGTLNPTSGCIQTNGRIAVLLELGSRKCRRHLDEPYDHHSSIYFPCPAKKVIRTTFFWL
jgi:lipopolysaccharide transport system ATP-binding protein